MSELFCELLDGWDLDSKAIRDDLRVLGELALFLAEYGGIL